MFDEVFNLVIFNEHFNFRCKQHASKITSGLSKFPYHHNSFKLQTSTNIFNDSLTSLSLHADHVTLGSYSFDYKTKNASG